MMREGNADRGVLCVVGRTGCAELFDRRAPEDLMRRAVVQHRSRHAEIFLHPLPGCNLVAGGGVEDKEPLVPAAFTSPGQLSHVVRDGHLSLTTDPWCDSAVFDHVTFISAADTYLSSTIGGRVDRLPTTTVR